MLEALEVRAKRVRVNLRRERKGSSFPTIKFHLPKILMLLMVIKCKIKVKWTIMHVGKL